MLAVAALADSSSDPLAKPQSSQAREHLAKGNKLYVIREFRAAIDEYKAGALIEDAPVFQYNLAQAYRLSGQYEEALWHYDRFVKRTRPVDPLKSSIEQFTIQMKAELEKLATKQQPLDAAPMPPSPTAPASEPAAQPSGRPSHWYQDRLGWGLTGTGTVLTGVAVGLLIHARGLEDDALQEPRESERASLQDRASTRRIAGYLLGSAGLAAIGAGTFKLAIHREERGSTVVSLAGRF